MKPLVTRWSTSLLGTLILAAGCGISFGSSTALAAPVVTVCQFVQAWGDGTQGVEGGLILVTDPLVASAVHAGFTLNLLADGSLILCGPAAGGGVIALDTAIWSRGSSEVTAEDTAVWSLSGTDKEETVSE